MKTKKLFRFLSNLKIFLVLTLIAAVISFTSCNKNTKSEAASREIASPPPPPPVSEVPDEPESEPFTTVDEMPLFPGGDTALLNYISKNTVYPAAAKEKNITGRVVIQFCVSAKGSVTKVSVLKSVDPDLDKEAQRVIKTLPKFEPGKNDGLPVAVWYQVPISFALN